LQALLRNPLADPYVLGVSGGTASFALIAMSCALPYAAIKYADFAGALVATGIVMGLESITPPFMEK
jgi:iron complex transport system permease protein